MIGRGALELAPGRSRPVPRVATRTAATAAPHPTATNPPPIVSLGRCQPVTTVAPATAAAYATPASATVPRSRRGATRTAPTASDMATVECPLGKVFHGRPKPSRRSGRSRMRSFRASVVTFAPRIATPTETARKTRPRTKPMNTSAPPATARLDTLIVSSTLRATSRGFAVDDGTLSGARARRGVGLPRSVPR